MLKYLKPSISDQDVYNIIYENIKTSTPFSLTRFGDGEIYFLNDNIPQELQQKVCKLWGYSWPKDFNRVRIYVCGIIVSALDSDIIGLLDPNNPICKKLKYDEKKWSILADRIDLMRTTVCDHQITRNKLFGDIHSFKKILQGNAINIISPNTVQLKNNNIDKLLGVNVSYTHIDNNRESMLESLKSIKENVVLFGASLFGKDLGVILKSYGKIAIDFGATLDGWAGLYTRPWFNTGAEQEHCLIEKSQ